MKAQPTFRNGRVFLRRSQRKMPWWARVCYTVQRVDQSKLALCCLGLFLEFLCIQLFRLSHGHVRVLRSGRSCITSGLKQPMCSRQLSTKRDGGLRRHDLRAKVDRPWRRRVLHWHDGDGPWRMGGKMEGLLHLHMCLRLLRFCKTRSPLLHYLATSIVAVFFLYVHRVSQDLRLRLLGDMLRHLRLQQSTVSSWASILTMSALRKIIIVVSAKGRTRRAYVSVCLLANQKRE